MADGKAVLSQQGRRLYDIPCCMAPLSLLQHPVVHGLNAEFYTGQAIGLQIRYNGFGDAVRPRRTAYPLNDAGFQRFIGRLEQLLLQRHGNGCKAAAVKGDFPVPSFTGRCRIGANELAYGISRRQPWWPVICH